MTFLDSSAIIDYLAGKEDVIDYLDGREPFFTSTVCVFEVLNGRVGTGSIDVTEERRRFDGVQSLGFNEELALEAARLQHDIMSDGDRLSARDALIASTARSTGDEFVVADDDFDTDVLEEYMSVVNLRQ